MEIVRDKEYYWLSRKDGVFYTLTLNSINHQNNYNMYIKNFVHLGYLSPSPRERIGNIKVFHRKSAIDELSDDFEKLHLKYLLEVIKTEKYFDFQKTVEIYFDLYDLLMEYPDVYLKNVDKLFKNKIFKRIMEGQIKRPVS